MKKFVYPIVLLMLFASSSFLIYLYFSSNSKINELNTEHDLLVKNNNLLKTKNENKSSQIKKFENNIFKAEKEIKDLKKKQNVSKKASDNSSIKNEEVQNNSEIHTTVPSDIPPSWQGSQEEWEKAKTQGWTIDDYEKQARASENESGTIQPSDPNYVPPSESDNIAVKEADKFRSDFAAEHGREPTSGEIQSAWAKEQGLE